MARDQFADHHRQDTKLPLDPRRLQEHGDQSFVNSKALDDSIESPHPTRSSRGEGDNSWQEYQDAVRQ